MAQEHADLSRPGTLPLSTGSSVWVRVCADRMDWCKAMISGPAGTPYENGLFVFDINLPADYPRVPPKVNLQTTGYGSVRFNPNLYNCGKVCLSLLGTWSGGQGEGWSEQSSTLLQVLVSIQSLIFVADPYFNEPGYETIYNTPSGRALSRQYNESRRVATVQYAMVDPLAQILVPMTSDATGSAGGVAATNPYASPASNVRRPGHHGTEFEDATRQHFALRRDAILRQVHCWQAEAASGGSASATSAGTAPAPTYASVVAHSAATAAAAAHMATITGAQSAPVGAPAKPPLTQHAIMLNTQVRRLEDLLAML